MNSTSPTACGKFRHMDDREIGADSFVFCNSLIHRVLRRLGTGFAIWRVSGDGRFQSE